MPLPPLLDVREIQSRLKLIFPEGTPHRTYVVREMAAKTVFAMLYVGAIDGTDRWLAPKHVYRLSSTQARMRGDLEREAFAVAAMRPGFVPKRGRWYADNSRESIRDETLREGLVSLGAATVKGDVPTTSGRPRYALQAGFANIFDPQLKGEMLTQAVVAWQSSYLSAEAQARLRIIGRGRTLSQDVVTITLPDRERRNMKAGPSSEITREVVEAFAPRFLSKPAVVWISESGNKVVERDDLLARSIGLDIRPERALPDIILADVDDPFLLIFVEVVATDGAVTLSRREALLQLVRETRINEKQVLFVTAFLDRSQSSFRKAISELAWGSFAWLAAEPDSIIVLDGTSPRGVKKLRDFLKI